MSSSEILIRLNPTRLSELTEDGSRAILSVATTTSNNTNTRPPPSKDDPRDQLTSKLLYSTASIGIEAALDGRTLLSNLEFTATTTAASEDFGGGSNIGSPFPEVFEKRALGVISPSDDTSAEKKMGRFAVTATDLYSTHLIEKAFEHTQVLTKGDVNTGGGDRIVQFIFPFSQNHQLMSITRPRLTLHQQGRGGGAVPVSSSVDGAFGRVMANVAVNALMDEVLLVNDQLSPLPPNEYLRRYAPPRPTEGTTVSGGDESEGELLRRLVQTNPSSIGEATIEYHASLLHQAAQVSHPRDQYTLLHRIMEQSHTGDGGGGAFTASSVVAALQRESILLSGGKNGGDNRMGSVSTPCTPSVFNTHPTSHTSQYAQNSDATTAATTQSNPPSANVLSDLLRNAAATELLNLHGFEGHAVACWSADGYILTNTFGCVGSGSASSLSGSSFTSADAITSARVFNTKVIPQLCETIASAGMGNIIRNNTSTSGEASGSLSGASRMRYKLVRLAANPAYRNGGSSSSAATTTIPPPPASNAVERDILCGARYVREQAEFLLTAVDATHGSSIALGLVFNNHIHDRSSSGGKGGRDTTSSHPPLSGILTKVSEWLKAEGVRIQELTAQSRRDLHVMSMAAAHILRTVRSSFTSSSTSSLHGPLHASPSVLVSHSTTIASNPASEQRAAVELVNSVIRRLLISCCDRDMADRLHKAAAEFVARNVSATVPQFHPGSGPLSQMFLCCGVVGVVISARTTGTSTASGGSVSMRRDVSTPSLHSLLQTMLCPMTRTSTTTTTTTTSPMLQYSQLRLLGRRVQQEVGSRAIAVRVLQRQYSSSSSYTPSMLSETKTIYTTTSSPIAATPSSLVSLISGGFGAGTRVKSMGVGSGTVASKGCPTLLATTTIVNRRSNDITTSTTDAIVGFVRIHSPMPLCISGAHGPLGHEAQRRLADELLRGGV